MVDWFTAHATTGVLGDPARAEPDNRGAGRRTADTVATPFVIGGLEHFWGGVTCSGTGFLVAYCRRGQAAYGGFPFISHHRQARVLRGRTHPRPVIAPR
jgi:hypothetical protein